MTSEIALFYNKMGEDGNPPLVILHGLFGLGDNWATLARQFSQHFTVYMPDQRNHGRSPNTDDFSYEILVADIHNFVVENLSSSPIHLIGHSMGGKVAMLFAQKYPNLIEKLVVVDMPMRHIAVNEQLKYLTILEKIDLNVATRAEVEAKMAIEISDFGIRQFLLKNLFRNQDDVFEWRINIPVLLKILPTLKTSVQPQHTFGKPTLFVRGANSNYITAADYTPIAQTFLLVSIVTIEGAGHWVHADKPKQLFDQIMAFFS